MRCFFFNLRISVKFWKCFSHYLSVLPFFIHSPSWFFPPCLLTAVSYINLFFLLCCTEITFLGCDFGAPDVTPYQDSLITLIFLLWCFPYHAFGKSHWYMAQTFKFPSSPTASYHFPGQRYWQSKFFKFTFVWGSSLPRGQLSAGISVLHTPNIWGPKVTSALAQRWKPQLLDPLIYHWFYIPPGCHSSSFWVHSSALNLPFCFSTGDFPSLSFQLGHVFFQICLYFFPYFYEFIIMKLSLLVWSTIVPKCVSPLQFEMLQGTVVRVVTQRINKK